MIKLRRLLILLLPTIIALSACSKKNTDKPTDPTGTNPPETILPTQPGRDASYLLKNAIQYGHDDKGTIFKDTTRTDWKWDEQNRIIFYKISYNNGMYLDSISWIYSDKKVREFHNASYWIDTYYNDKGRADSTVGVNGNTSSVTYYFYDANANDTLAKGYTTNTGVKLLFNTIRKTYVNNMLSIEDQQLGNRQRYYYATYTDGNLMKETKWVLGTGDFSESHEYTYNDVLAGGFYSYWGYKKNIITTDHQLSSYAPTDLTITKTYTYDSKNRVTLMKELNSAYNTEYLYTEFTYY